MEFSHCFRNVTVAVAVAVKVTVTCKKSSTSVTVFLIDHFPVGTVLTPRHNIYTPRHCYCYGLQHHLLKKSSAFFRNFAHPIFPIREYPTEFEHWCGEEEYASGRRPTSCISPVERWSSHKGQTWRKETRISIHGNHTERARTALHENFCCKKKSFAMSFQRFAGMGTISSIDWVLDWWLLSLIHISFGEYDKNIIILSSV